MKYNQASQQIVVLHVGVRILRFPLWALGLLGDETLDPGDNIFIE